MFGLLDDLLIVPLGIWLVLKLVPDELMETYREEAETREAMPGSKWGAISVIFIWALIVAFGYYLLR